MTVLNCIDLELWEYNQFGERRLRDDIDTFFDQPVHDVVFDVDTLDWTGELGVIPLSSKSSF